MSSSSSKVLPTFSKAKNYQDWLKEKQHYTSFMKKNEALAAVLELREDEISADNDEDTII